MEQVKVALVVVDSKALTLKSPRTSTPVAETVKYYTNTLLPEGGDLVKHIHNAAVIWRVRNVKTYKVDYFAFRSFVHLKEYKHTNIVKINLLYLSTSYIEQK